MDQSCLESAWRELDEPALGGGWELFLVVAGIHIHRLYHEESCLYEYKIYGTFTDFAPELFVDVYMDLEYRKQWDSYVKELYELEHCGEKLIYWEVKYPFLLSNRDCEDIETSETLQPRVFLLTPLPPVRSPTNAVFPPYHSQHYESLTETYVYRRELHDLDINGRKIWVISAKSKCVPGLPAKSGMIRVEDYHQTVVIESDGKQGSRVFLHYFDNPGGMIPTFLINWAAKSGVPSFLKDMQKACANYSEYCKKSGKSQRSTD